MRRRRANKDPLAVEKASVLLRRYGGYLGKTQREVITRYYGLDGSPPRSFARVAQEMPFAYTASGAANAHHRGMETLMLAVCQAYAVAWITRRKGFWNPIRGRDVYSGSDHWGSAPVAYRVREQDPTPQEAATWLVRPLWLRDAIAVLESALDL